MMLDLNQDEQEILDDYLGGKLIITPGADLSAYEASAKASIANCSLNIHDQSTISPREAFFGSLQKFSDDFLESRPDDFAQNRDEL